MKAIGLTLIAIGLTACGRHEASHPAVPAERPPTRAEIWTAIQPMAERYRLSPGFIYALVAAESNFDPSAHNDTARGLMQIKPAAWHAVSNDPYAPTVWNWRKNLVCGVDYLAYSRAYLHRKTTFSYPLLLAAFHYGLDYVEERNFDVGCISIPDSPIYHQLWSGNLTPVPPP